MNRIENMTEVKELREHLYSSICRYLRDLRPSSDGGVPADLPEYEIAPTDYMEFAEECLTRYGQEVNERRRTQLAIDCVAHLKRAIDSQTETFLGAFGLTKVFQERKGGLPSKLEFLDRAGVIGGKSLRRLNSVRNSVEHDFSVPRITDLEVFYDLTSAFVAVIEAALLSTWNAEIELVNEDVRGQDNAVLRFNYNASGPSIRYICNDLEEPANSCELEASASNFDDFVYFFRVYHLIRRYFLYPDSDRFAKLFEIEDSSAERISAN